MLDHCVLVWYRRPARSGPVRSLSARWIIHVAGQASWFYIELLYWYDFCLYSTPLDSESVLLFEQAHRISFPPLRKYIRRLYITPELPTKVHNLPAHDYWWPFLYKYWSSGPSQFGQLPVIFIFDSLSSCDSIVCLYQPIKTTTSKELAVSSLPLCLSPTPQA